MTSGTKIIHELWRALELELPAKRRPQLARFLAGFKPTQPSAYGSLLRTMARALIESGNICARRDAPQDPVELIAAAIEVGIEQWDRNADDIWNDVGIRIAAFELMYRVRANDARIVALARVVESFAPEQSVALAEGARDAARHDVVATAATSEHAEAALAEIIIVGHASKGAAGLDASAPKALLLSRVALLVRADRFPEALEVCQAIIDRVPGHTLALQQAARCCFECGDSVDADAYSRRAFGRIEARRGAS